ncbi:MAG TPA: DUF2269 family protein [Methylomirabilota bacterium]|nr:DUF2269 family protein [Methylomirabilota bacterium]
MYLVLKLLHVGAVVMFLGNITTGLFWHRHAARTRDPRLLHHAMDGILRSDRWFTNPAAATIAITGVLAAIVGHLPILRTRWIAGGLALFIVSGLVFVLRVTPLQKQLRALAHAGLTSGAFDHARYDALARRWELWGAVALLLPFAAFVLMILKP